LIGIYELNGDDLKICFNLSHSDNKTPTSFDVKAGKPPALVPVVYVLKRDPVKDAPKKEAPKKADADASTSVQVRFLAPQAAKIRRFEEEDKTAHEMPCRFTFEKPGTYRLKLTNIPNHPGLELYPTVEVYPSTAKTATFLTHAAIPVEFTEEEIDKAVKGKLATTAVCLHQDGDQAFAVTGRPTNMDTVGLAKEKGPILLVVRLGSIDLEGQKDGEDKEYRAALIAALQLLAARGELAHVKAILAKHPDLLPLPTDAIGSAALSKELREVSVRVTLKSHLGKTVYFMELPGRVGMIEVAEDALERELSRLAGPGQKTLLLEVDSDTPYAEVVKVLLAAKKAGLEQMRLVVPDQKKH
jgi:biopolymer transport protein ExbD